MIKIRPIITEKSVSLSKLGKFTIEIPKNVNKPEIIASLMETFKLNIISVKILNKKSTIKRKPKGKALDRGFKKAVVSLKKGEIMPGFDTFLKEEEKAAKAKKNAAKTLKTKEQSVSKQREEND